MKLDRGFISFLILCTFVFAQAPNVTSITAANQNGQTFVTYTEPTSGVCATSSNCRYKLYRATTCPITSTTGAGVALVQFQILNNGGQLNPELGNAGWLQSYRVNSSNAMATLAGYPSAALSFGTGLAVYTNQATATACYAVVTQDITGANADSPISAGNNSMSSTVSESAGTIVPILQGQTSTASYGPPGSQNIGKPVVLYLYPSGSAPLVFGNQESFWGDPTMGLQDGMQEGFNVFDDISFNLAATGISHQIGISPNDPTWGHIAGGVTSGAVANSQKYWLGNMDVPNSPTAYSPTEDTQAHVYPYGHNQLNFLLPWVISTYSANANQLFCFGKSMGGYGCLHFALRHSTRAFAGIFVGDPASTVAWPVGTSAAGSGTIPQVDYGALSGTVNTTNGSHVITPSSPASFPLSLCGNGAGANPFNLDFSGTVKTITATCSSSSITMNGSTFAGGSASFITGSGLSCGGLSAGQPCGAGIGSATNTSADTMPDGVTTYYSYVNEPAYVAANCGSELPFVGIGAGRLDTTTQGDFGQVLSLVNAFKVCHAGYAIGWSNDIHGTTSEGNVTALTTSYASHLSLATSYPAFTNFSLDSTIGVGAIASAVVGNGGTGYTTGDTVSLNQYGCTGDVLTVTASGGVVSSVAVTQGGTYCSPLQTGTNIATNTLTGSGSGLTLQPVTDGAGAGGSITTTIYYVNYGWSWTPITDSAVSWSASFSNSQVTSGTCPTTSCATSATVDVTPRNAQNFKLFPGQKVNWTAGSQSGTATADSYGLVTIPSLQLSSGSTTLSLNLAGVPVSVGAAQLMAAGLTE